MTLLAETVPVPSEMDWRGFLVVLMFLAVLVEKLFGIGRWVRGNPERREVSFTAEHPSKAEFAEFRREVKTDVNELHDKINNVDRTCSATAAQCEMINTNLLHLSSRVNRV